MLYVSVETPYSFMNDIFVKMSQKLHILECAIPMSTLLRSSMKRLVAGKTVDARNWNEQSQAC